MAWIPLRPQADYGVYNPGGSSTTTRNPGTRPPINRGGGGGYTGGGGGYGGGGASYNYATDPSLQEFMAYYNRERQAAGSRRDELRRRRLIQLGSRDVASRILGANDPILASISNDPNSTSDFGRVLKQYNDALRNTDESTSFENTYWGTGRAQEYQESAYGRQQTEADLIKGAEGDIQSYQDAYDNMLRQLEMEKRGAEQEAWMRQMYANLYSSGDGGGGAGGAPVAGGKLAMLGAGDPRLGTTIRGIPTSPQMTIKGQTIGAPVPPAPSGGTGSMEFPYSVAGYSNQQVYNAASAYAQSHGGYVPHMVMSEGQIIYQNGVPGVMIKYNTPTGSSTEWTPLG